MKIKIPFINIKIHINEPKYKPKGIYGVTKEARESLATTRPMKKI